MNLAEIERIENEATIEEQAEQPQAEAGQQQPQFTGLDLSEEFAEFLDMAANIAAVGFSFNPIKERFNHDANVNISKSAIKLCERYGIDARKFLIGEDSAIGVWLGFVVAVGMPSFACYQEYKFLKAKDVEAEAEKGAENGNNQQSSE